MRIRQFFQFFNALIIHKLQLATASFPVSTILIDSILLLRPKETKVGLHCLPSHTDRAYTNLLPNPKWWLCFCPQLWGSKCSFHCVTQQWGQCGPEMGQVLVASECKWDPRLWRMRTAGKRMPPEPHPGPAGSRGPPRLPGCPAGSPVPTDSTPEDGEQRGRDDLFLMRL